MIQHATVGEEDLRELANQRAQTVRDALVSDRTGQRRQVIHCPAKPLTSEEKAKPKRQTQSRRFFSAVIFYL